jgi:hypothetical protein
MGKKSNKKKPKKKKVAVKTQKVIENIIPEVGEIDDIAALIRILPE